MKKYTVRKYQPSDYALWNDFINHAKNATFLFHRDFMEYHADRFEDFSLLVFHEEKLVAVFPANISNGVLYSHQGLTYGGLILSPKIKFTSVVYVFRDLLVFLEEQGFHKIIIKEIPFIYSTKFSDDLKYLLFIVNAHLYRRDLLTVLELSSDLKLSKDRKEGVKRGVKSNLEIVESDDFSDFWNQILLPNLSAKHNAKPVHTLEEITLLKQKFPNNIRLFKVYREGAIVAGTVVFESNNVAHSQYTSGNYAKNESGSLDYLHYHLITNVFSNKKYFDFGISNEYNGRNVNKGLLYWKETFGSGHVAQDFYEVETRNHKLLDDVLI